MGHNKPIAEQFWNHVDPLSSGSCWLWKGSKKPTGYGQMRRLGKCLRAHRVSWEIHNGAIPRGMCVMHKCDNPACVNPQHLCLGSQQDNLRDMRIKARGKGGSMPGTSNPASKLTENEVVEIRDKANIGISFRQLGRIYNLNKKTVASIVRKKTWQHI